MHVHSEFNYRSHRYEIVPRAGTCNVHLLTLSFVCAVETYGLSLCNSAYVVQENAALLLQSQNR